MKIKGNTSGTASFLQVAHLNVGRDRSNLEVQQFHEMQNDSPNPQGGGGGGKRVVMKLRKVKTGPRS